MKTRAVLASEFTSKNRFNLEAKNYVKTEEERFKEKRMKVLDRFIAARARYLLSSGWIPRILAHPSEPLWWKDPSPEPGEQEHFREEDAALRQEMKDNDLR